MKSECTECVAIKNNLDPDLVEEVKSLVTILDLYRSVIKAAPQLLELAENEGLDDYHWAALHEHTDAELSERYSSFYGVESFTDLYNGEKKPLTALANAIHNSLEEIGASEWTEEQQDDCVKNLPEIIGVVVSSMASTEAVMQRGRSLSNMTQAVRAGGSASESAFLQALVTNPCMATNPSIAKYHSKSVKASDPDYLKRFTSAMTGAKPAAKDPQYDPLRFVLACLRGMGVLEKLSEDDLAELFCDELKMYGEGLDDPYDSLKRFVKRWKKETAY